MAGTRFLVYLGTSSQRARVDVGRSRNRVRILRQEQPGDLAATTKASSLRPALPRRRGVPAAQARLIRQAGARIATSQDHLGTVDVFRIRFARWLRAVSDLAQSAIGFP